MNNVIMKSVTVTADWTPLSAVNDGHGIAPNGSSFMVCAHNTLIGHDYPIGETRGIMVGGNAAIVVNNIVSGFCYGFGGPMEAELPVPTVVASNNVVHNVQAETTRWPEG